MSQTNGELLADAQDLASDVFSNPVKEYQIRGRRVVRHDPVQAVKALMLMQGLASSKRGISVAKIERAD